jgi:hypothetical protein
MDVWMYGWMDGTTLFIQCHHIHHDALGLQGCTLILFLQLDIDIHASYISLTIIGRVTNLLSMVPAWSVCRGKAAPLVFLTTLLAVLLADVSPLYHIGHTSH